MTSRGPAALLLLLALGGDEPEWTTVKNEQETYQFDAPAGFKEVTPTKAERIRHVRYEGAPYLSSQIKVYAYKGQTNLDHFMKFVEKDVGGNVIYDEGSTTRFSADIQVTGSEWWVSLVEGKTAGGIGYYIEVQIPKKVFDETEATWQKVRDSFKVFAEKPETYEVPATWSVLKNDWYAVTGPTKEIKDAKARAPLENRMFRVLTWLDPQTGAAVKMFRELFGDTRAYVARGVVHVLPTADAFKAEAGDLWAEGRTAIYLPDSKDRVIVVDGSPDSALQEPEIVAEAGVQYVDSRIGKAWPWMRAGFRVYYDNGCRREKVAGLYPPEAMVRAKEVFGKAPPTFEDLMKKDEAGLRALGDDGRIACWGFLQYGLHGPDGGVRNLFRKFLKDAVGATDLQPVWDKSVAAYKEETKKTFRPRDVDSGVKKWFREMKPEKR